MIFNLTGAGGNNIQFSDFFLAVFVIVAVCGSRGNKRIRQKAGVHTQLRNHQQSFQTGKIKLERGHQHRVGNRLLHHMIGKNQRGNVGKQISPEQNKPDFCTFCGRKRIKRN